MHKILFFLTDISRADYWVSNERKFCDFCKCWIADNKPSISFHENGKKHKLNVAKRISEISKQSIKDEKAQQKVDIQMRQMEDAAMRAYAVDICNGADMTSKAINALHGGGSAAADRPSTSTSLSFASSSSSNAFVSPTVETIRTNGFRPGPSALPARAIDPMLPPIDIMEEEEKAKRERMKRKTDVNKPWESQEGGSTSLWCEAKSDDGDTYYWNVKTNESRWDVPKEGYMTLEEYNRINKIAETQQQIQLQKESMFMRGNADEIVAKFQREKLKQRRPKPSATEVKKQAEEKESYQTYEEPGWSAKPLGQWTTVAQRPSAPVDLQLPVQSHEFVYVPAALTEPEPPIKNFKEKTIVKLETDEDNDIKKSFKKRKLGIKRNVRQRTDDD